MNIVFESTPQSTEGRLLALMLEGNADEARQLFGDSVSVNDPTVGRVDGDKEFRNYVVEFENMFLADAVELRFGRVIAGGRNSVTEFELFRIVGDERIRIWGAIVADLNGSLLDAVRVYYKRVLINGLTTNRRLPILTEERPDNQYLPVVADYIEALKTHDVEACTSLFEDDARFLASGEHVFDGQAGLHELYTNMFKIRTRGVFLEHPNAFHDGTTNCVEFNSVRDADKPGHAGVALYVVGESGKLTHAIALDEP